MLTGPKVEILLLSKDEVESLITVKDAVDAAEQAYRAIGEGQVTQYHTSIKIKGINMINTMPAHIKSLNLYGTKLISGYSSREPGDNLPLIWGALIVLNHPENGQPYTIMDGTAITNMRTAGGHGVAAAKYLAKKDSKTLAIIGCGAEARTGFRSFMNHFSLELVKIYDIKPEAMFAFTEEMGKEFTIRIMPARSAKEAVEGADIILMVTTAVEPLVLEPWVEEGCFVDAMTGFSDLDAMLSAKADKWVIGTHEGDGLLIEEEHFLFPEWTSRDNVYADMGEIVTGAKPGRENDQERIIYTHMGMGAHDVILAHKAYTRAVEKGVGVKVYI